MNYVLAVILIFFVIRVVRIIAATRIVDGRVEAPVFWTAAHYVSLSIIMLREGVKLKLAERRARK